MERRQLECVTLLFGQLQEGSPLNVIDGFTLRTILEKRWQPICITSRIITDAASFYVDPDFNILHNIKDKPAIVSPFGMLMWYSHGQLHRDGDLPAVLNEKEDSWTHYKYGLKHRDGDKPAVKDGEGTLIWYKTVFVTEMEICRLI